MNERTDHVLEAIDHAIADWEVSSDAMRWTPDPAPRDDRPAGARPRGLGPGWIEVGYVDETVPPPRFRGQRLQGLVIDEPSLPRIEVAPIRVQPVDLTQMTFSIGPFNPQIFHPRDVAALTRALAPAMQQIAARFQAIARAARAANRALAPLVDQIGEPGPPEDPRERALRARQHRNTGPRTEPFAHRGRSTRH